MSDEYDILVDAIESAIGDEPVKYIICDDMLGFEEYEELLVGNKYVIQQFGQFYVALIF